MFGRKVNILFLFLSLSVIQTFATIEVRSRQINIENGLSNNTVRYMTQDSKGFVWLGTFSGLDRYDGSSFVSYLPSSDASVSLSDRRVHGVEEDQNGYLWVYSSSEQFSCYDLKRARFVDFTGCGEQLQEYSSKLLAANGDVWLWHNKNGARCVHVDNDHFSSEVYKVENHALPSNQVNFIQDDSQNNVWIGTSSGLVRIDSDGRKIIYPEGQHFLYTLFTDAQLLFCTLDGTIFRYNANNDSLVKQSSLPKRSTLTGQLSLHNKWYFFTAKGIFSYHTETSLVEPETILGESISMGYVSEDNKGNCFVYNHSGSIWYYNTALSQWKKFDLISEEKLSHIDAERYSVVHDSRDIIWISTYGNGLYAYDIAKDEITHFSASLTGVNHIASNYLLQVMEDRSGGIWVSAEFAGITCLNIINEGARRLFPESPNLLDRSNTVRMITRIADETWVATRRGGLYVYDKDFELKKVHHNLPYNIYAVIKDKYNKTWVGSRGSGLKIGDKWYRRNPNDPNSLSNDNVFSMFSDSKHRVWIGTFGGGLNLAIDKDGHYEFRHFFTDNYLQRQIRSICEDHNGWIWVGTSNGVYVFDPDKLIHDPKAYYYYNAGVRESYGYEVKHICCDRQGEVWIAVSGIGVSRCVPNDDYSSLQFQFYRVSDGLCNNIVQSIVEDNRGNLWFATEYGLSKYVRSDDLFESYFLSPYSLGNVYTEAAACQSADGSCLLFGTNHGFIVVAPAEMRKTTNSFPVVFTNLNVNGIDVRPDEAKSLNNYSMAYTKTITLKHYQNSLKIDFSSFNYIGLSQTKYSYFLKNYDRSWSTPSVLSFASYKMLPPGKYELLVKSCNELGVWSGEVALLFITVKSPFYLTAWAFLIYIVIAGGILMLVYRVLLNFNRLRNKITVEKQLTDYKLVFFTNISHEFRTPLTLIQGALEHVKKIDSVPNEASHPLKVMEKGVTRMMRLIDQLLEFRKMQNNKLALSLEKTDIMALLYEIFLSFKDMAESKNMEFLFLPSPASYKMYIDKGKMDKIVYNLLSNAFKYTPNNGKICLIVEVDVSANKLLIRVADNGVGIDKEKQSELFKRFMQSHFSRDSMGIGLHLTHELVSVHKGEISYAGNEHGGSVFTVALPLSEEVYEKNDFLISAHLTKPEVDSSVIKEDVTLEIPSNLPPLNEQKILLIEDDEDVRNYLKEALGAYFQVSTAANGKDGFELAQEMMPDLIVSDVLMPEMSGYEVTAKLKKDFNTSHIPIVLITALALPENHLEGIESGADAYLTKPFSVQLLITRIVKLLEQRELLKEKYSKEPGLLRTTVYASKIDKQFVDELNRIISENIDNPAFSIDGFATMMKMGRTLFYRKVKGLTGYSPNEYLRTLRMKKAAELLLNEPLTVAEVAYKVGIDDPFYFSKCFKAQFGESPSAFKKKQE